MKIFLRNKKIFLIFTFSLLFLFVNRVSATDMFYNNSILYNEDLIYEDFSTIDGYNINNYPNIFCHRSGDSYDCYSLSTDLINSLEYDSLYEMYKIKLEDCHYYYLSRYKYSFDFSITEKRNCSYNNSFISLTTREAYSNFYFNGFTDEQNSLVTKISFSKYITSPESPEEPIYEIGASKIYLPIELNENQCPIVYNKDTIRVFDKIPTENTSITYTDYYINSHYLSNTGIYEFLNELPTCIDLDNFTTSYYYRFDFDEILIIFFIILFIVYFIFGKILHSFFIGFKH